MNTREIEILLEKYFEAKTSKEEENLLKQFFLSGDVPAHLKHCIPLFHFAKSEQQLVAKTDFEADLMNRMEQGRSNSYNSRRLWYVASGIAAAVLLLLTILTETRQVSTVADRAYTPEEIQLAYLQTKEVLSFASGKINQGASSLSNVSKINSGTSAIDQLSKLDKGITQLNQGLKQIDNGSGHIGKFSKFNLLTNQ